MPSNKHETEISPENACTFAGIVFGFAAGVLSVVGVRAGWRKLSAWTTGTKPDYRRIADGYEIGGIIGGILGWGLIRSSLVPSKSDDRAETAPVSDNSHPPETRDQLTGDKSFGQEVTSERISKNPHSCGRS